ncbi:uncharacterized protein EV422DRAFT_566186 [Fimicolochytrium jonesii]|uniref:uncharacterized protein n=1 Tax=Fimicolochytrium jonesii TaxID=1396493 RepID=UPI0022FE0FC7|nr:uncharacterized protein EV422DRAFT_566186 [Fimicolochytrium jonesii]KAI8822498.1 hypothetical protein EV422DRAFT_566186 [Fimicolochytrium jonesii]
MHLSLVESIVADAQLELLFPATDAQDAGSILGAPARKTAYYDERLHCYLMFRPSQAPSATRVTPAMLAEIAAKGLDAQLSATLSNSAPGSSTLKPNSVTVAPPPAAHHLGLGQGARHRAATTNVPVARKPTRPPMSQAGYLASPVLNKRTTSLKPALGPPSPAASAAAVSSESALKTPTPPPKPKWRGTKEEVCHTQQYSPISVSGEPILVAEQSCCLFPFNIPIGNGEADLCDADDFDTPNLLAGLANDPSFNPDRLPTHRLPHHLRKPTMGLLLSVPRTVKASMKLSPILDMRLNIVNSGNNAALLSFALANRLGDGLIYTVEDVSTDLTSAAMTQIGALTAREKLLSHDEELHVLYQVSLLTQKYGINGSMEIPSLSTSPATSRVASLASLASNGDGGAAPLKRNLTITITGSPTIPGLRGQSISSHWFAPLTFDNMPGKTMLNIVPTYVQKHDFPEMPSHAEDVEFDGLQLSLTVLGQVQLHKMFTVQLFLMNCSKDIWDLTIIIPMKPQAAPSKSVPSKSVDDAPPRSKVGLQFDLRMSDKDLLRNYQALESREVAIVCLENFVELGPLRPGACETLNLHFVGMKGMFHYIDHIQLRDRISGRTLNLRDVCEIHVDTTVGGWK